MDKMITITITEDTHHISYDNRLKNFEILGLMRFYEKYFWTKMYAAAIEQDKGQSKKKTSKKK